MRYAPAPPPLAAAVQPLTPDELALVNTHRGYLNASLFIALLPSLIMLLAYFRGGTVHRGFMVAMAIGWGFFYVVRWRYWRCPRCSKALQNDPTAKACGSCGVMLVAPTKT